nr:hypothetical protein [Tanacetum cinerariifolium]
PRTGHGYLPTLAPAQHSYPLQPFSSLPQSPNAPSDFGGALASTPSGPLLRLSRTIGGPATTASTAWPDPGTVARGTSS